MASWLHSQGYTFFSIPKLTYNEIKMLANAKDRQTKKEKSEQKRMERKAKRGRKR